MPKYEVYIEQAVGATWEVEAENREQAQEIAGKKWQNQEWSLDMPNEPDRTRMGLYDGGKFVPFYQYGKITPFDKANAVPQLVSQGCDFSGYPKDALANLTAGLADTVTELRLTPTDTDPYEGYDGVHDLRPLQAFKNLQRLEYCGTANLAPLSECKNLERLAVWHHTDIDPAPLAECKKLRHLDLSTSDVIDLAPLAGLKNLQTLNLCETKVTDLTPLAELKNLETLFLEDTRVTDLSPLAKLPNLKRLIMGGSQVSDLSPLAGMASLEEVILDECHHLTDISALGKLPNLQRLDLSYTAFEDETIQSLREKAAAQNAAIDQRTGPEQIDDRLHREIARHDYGPIAKELEDTGRAAFIAGSRFVVVVKDRPLVDPRNAFYTASILGPDLAPVEVADKFPGIMAPETLVKRAAFIAFEGQGADRAAPPIHIDPGKLFQDKLAADRETVEAAMDRLAANGFAALNVRNQQNGVNEYWLVSRDERGDYDATVLHDGYVEHCPFVNKQQAFQRVLRSVLLGEFSNAVQETNPGHLRAMLGMIEGRDPCANAKGAGKAADLDNEVLDEQCGAAETKSQGRDEKEPAQSQAQGQGWSR